MYIFVNEFEETGTGDFNRSLCSTNPESFMQFENYRCNRGRDPMDLPILECGRIFFSVAIE